MRTPCAPQAGFRHVGLSFQVMSSSVEGRGREGLVEPGSVMLARRGESRVRSSRPLVLVLASFVFTNACGRFMRPVSIPEPEVLLLLLLGLAGLFFGRRAFQSAFRSLAANRDARRKRRQRKDGRAI